ncbi:hypothetical protein [Kineococcus terrestris]|uniref:hypothetical protein n=1 Tax=Kineococcus terrestris TaxID=2044856 RepID=UPI0034DB5215
MSGTLVAAVCLLSLAMGVWAVALTALDRRVGRASLVALAVTELSVLVMVVAGFVDVARGVRPAELATSIAYLVVAPFMLPAGAFWAMADRSRPSTLVLAVACLAVIVLSYRVWVLWQVQR